MTHYTAMTIDLSTVTPFQKRVYEALLTIPAGKVTTYKFLAEAVGVRSFLAIGQALKRNPFAPEVPCHRVIASNLSIGGYSGQRTGRLINRKKNLLKKEGVVFVDDTLQDSRQVIRPQIEMP